MRTYRTLTGRTLDLDSLSPRERAALAAVQAAREEHPDWNAFGQRWLGILRERVWGKRRRVPLESTLYRLCQDLELRLGVAAGLVAPPDYRSRLFGLIGERYGSRYAFCKATGIDQGNLSKVLASKKHLSQGALQRVADAFDLIVDLVPRQDALDAAAGIGDALRLEQLEARVATLEAALARAKASPRARPRRARRAKAS